MSGGLLALLDDVAAIAKVAAASLDDVGAMAEKAAIKATGIVIDDAAVTPRYVVGFASDRELPIIGKIALGSLLNKLLYLLPGGLLLNLVAPWAITPLLMLGGIYLCFEGYEKIHSSFSPHEEAHDTVNPQTALGEKSLEDEKVSSAIRTDMILSAEIMALTLADVSTAPFSTQLAVLAAVGIGITALVYGVVALIVKADDVGLALVRRDRAGSRQVGRLLVNGMPMLLKWLSLIGTAAMLWVGGGIIIHGLAGYGWHGVEHGIHGLAKSASASLGVFTGLVNWLFSAALAGAFGVIIGLLAERLWSIFPKQFFQKLKLR
jgi:uncharacterized protein